MDIRVIEDEIEQLEQAETSFENCNELAILYTVRDHLQPNIRAYSYGGSEFLLACSRADIGAVLQIMDEHMKCIKLLYPKEYNAILDKIKSVY